MTPPPASTSDARDDAFREAVQRQDLEQAEAVLDQSAAAVGFNLGPFYHGTNRKFSQFDLNYFGATDDGYYGVGFCFSPSREAAEGYGAIVKRVHLQVRNPLVLPESSTMDHECLFDARDILARVLDDPEVGTIRTIPKGYELQKRHCDEGSWGGERDEFIVGPKEETWDEPDVRYGPGRCSPLAAIVAFHDDLRDVAYDCGWLNGLLKRTGRRKEFAKLAEAKGYDAIVMYDVDTLSVSEVLLWDPSQIAETGALPTDGGPLRIPSQRFAGTPAQPSQAVAPVLSVPLPTPGSPEGYEVVTLHDVDTEGTSEVLIWNPARLASAAPRIEPPMKLASLPCPAAEGSLPARVNFLQQ